MNRRRFFSAILGGLVTAVVPKPRLAIFGRERSLDDYYRVPARQLATRVRISQGLLDAIDDGTISHSYLALSRALIYREGLQWEM